MKSRDLMLLAREITKETYPLYAADACPTIRNAYKIWKNSEEVRIKDIIKNKSRHLRYELLYGTLISLYCTDTFQIKTDLKSETFCYLITADYKSFEIYFEQTFGIQIRQVKFLAKGKWSNLATIDLNKTSYLRVKGRLEGDISIDFHTRIYPYQKAHYRAIKTIGRQLNGRRYFS